MKLTQRLSATVSAHRPGRRALVSGAMAVLLAAGVGVGTAASAQNHAPRSDKQIPNLGLVEQNIEAYYGDTVVDGEHYASADSNYAKQVNRIEAGAERAMGEQLRHGHHGGRPALVLDIDDTTLLTYNYEQEQGFGYTPNSNAAYIASKDMHPVFGMPQLVRWARKHGITVFFLTGRPESQRQDTVRQLTDAGYGGPLDTTHLLLKNKDNPPSYLPCGASCTTDDYKSLTRAHIQQEGFRILADMGDQYSDLSEGHTGRTFKLPNPMYYLP